ncbi:hypothetical protein M8C21_027122, partial [Ambrosia artemisiifolia]
MMNQLRDLIQLHLLWLKICSGQFIAKVKMQLGNLERLHLMWWCLTNTVPSEELLTGWCFFMKERLYGKE